MNPYSENFSYDFYKQIVDVSKSIGSIVSMTSYEKEFDKKGIFFIWRHDVDVSLEYALQLAKIEESIGISSTYMFIPNYSLYNINSKKDKRIISEIEDMGHEIGLHFDLNSMTLDTNNIESAISKNLKQLNQVTSSIVSSISFHRPIKEFLYGEKYICDCLNAYSKELMEFYISDSKGSWRNGDPLKSILSNEFKVAHVLTHPIWWSNKHIPPIQKLNLLLSEKCNNLSENQYYEYKKNIDLNLPGVTKNS